MKRTVVWGLLALLLTGCASSTQPTTSSNPQHVVCKRERIMGSHIAQRVCRTVAQIETDREDARRTMDQRRSVNTRGGH